MTTIPGPSRSRQVGQWLVLAVVMLAIVGAILYVGQYFFLGSCACQPSPPPTSIPTAWHLLLLG